MYWYVQTIGCHKQKIQLRSHFILGIHREYRVSSDAAFTAPLHDVSFTVNRECKIPDDTIMLWRHNSGIPISRFIAIRWLNWSQITVGPYDSMISISRFMARTKSEKRRRRLVTAWYLFHRSISPTGSSGTQWETIQIFTTLLLVSYTVSSSLDKVIFLEDKWIAEVIIWQNKCIILAKIKSSINLFKSSNQQSILNATYYVDISTKILYSGLKYIATTLQWCHKSVKVSQITAIQLFVQLVQTNKK